MEPEFIVDEEESPMPVVQLREAVVAAIRREYELRQSLQDKNLSYEQELLQEAEFLRRLVAAKRSRCDELIRAEQMRQAGRTERPEPITAVDFDPNARSETDNIWLRRVEMIQRALDNVLERHHVTRYIPSGKALPERDHIQGTVTGTGQEPGTIVEIIRPAYLWRGELLCAAEVLTAA